jgi:hypothetical protein
MDSSSMRRCWTLGFCQRRSSQDDSEWPQTRLRSFPLLFAGLGGRQPVLVLELEGPGAG